MGDSAVDVVVLAAGGGVRLGLGPKAHVALRGATFLARVVKACTAARLGRVWVVGSVHDEKMGAECKALGVELVVNKEPDRGMFSSVQAGLRAAMKGDPGAGVMVFPVDVPLVSSATLRDLATRIAVDRQACARPLFDGHSGHPVAIGKGLLQRLVAASAELTLRDALALAGAALVDVETTDAGVSLDINLPSDLASARGRVKDA